uniref:PARP-type domain-containing protein n=1 Tax=Panagrolaimus sp. PS1159 TaxID=55785 RepID=A0AC35GH29_9BILA
MSWCKSYWAHKYDDKVQRCFFEYAISDRSRCGGCQKMIPLRSLRVKCEYGSRYYHFDCFFKYETTTKCDKNEIMIDVQRIQSSQSDLYIIQSGLAQPSFIVHENAKHLVMFNEYPFVSLEIFDKNLDHIVPIMKPKDIDRIRYHVALAQEGITPYYVPKIENNLPFDPCPYYLSKAKFRLKYDKKFYHPECLSKSGLVNIDAKEIDGYDKLDDDSKKLLDDLFEIDNEADAVFMATNKLGSEHCSSKDCINMVAKYSDIIFFADQDRNIYKDDLRIRCGHLSYHPRCFEELHKVNIDGRDIKNYDKMNEREKMILDSCFIKSDDFDIPFVEKAKRDDYCKECTVEKTPSKFPYPYTVKKGQIQIRFKGNIYHPICLQRSGIINIQAKNMKNYETLSEKAKQGLDNIFMKKRKQKIDNDQSSFVVEELSLNQKKDDASTNKIGESIKKTNTKRRRSSVEESSDDKPPVSKKSKLNKSAVNETLEVPNDSVVADEKLLINSKSKCREITAIPEDEPSTSKNDKSFIDEESENSNKKLKQKKKKNSTNENISDHQNSESGDKMEKESSATIFDFHKPSNSMFEKICTKLNIEYCNKVEKLWKKIIFNQIDIETMPSIIETEKFETENFYGILSKLFTGKSTQNVQIQETIVGAFRQKLVDSGEISSKKFDNLYLNNTAMTDEQYQFVARFLHCRILVFHEEEIKKFGRWNSTSSDRITLVFSFSDGKYSIVLNL